MAGILDFLTGQPDASPWNVFYPSPIQGEADQAQQAREAAAAALARRFRGAPVEAPAPDTFGAGATPFGFAGPGSMNVDPSMIAAPPAASLGSAPTFGGSAAPVPFAASPARAPAPPTTDVSSINRGPAPADDGPDSYVNVGSYKMPMIGAPGDAPQPAAAVATPGAPSSAPPFSLAGAGSAVGDRLMKATRGFLGNLGNGPIGALAGGLGALVTGQNTDPTSIAAEQNSLTAQALLKKGASPAEVSAARYNPALQKALIEQYYGKDKWAVVQTGEDADGRKIFMQQNQVDGTLRPLAGAPAAGAGGASDTVTGPDGKPITIPPGVNRKEFIKRVSQASADAATGKGTEAQNKAAAFATRMTQAEGVLNGLQNQGLSFGQKIAGEIPVAGNYLQSADYQKYKTAASSFITAMLRQESGAAVNKSEFDRYEKELFPQPGDAPAVVQQKAAMRAAAIRQMQHSAGPSYQAPKTAPSGTVNVGGQSISWSVN